MPHLDQLLDFVRFTHAAHKVERVARIPGTDRSATMVEHSYQLTLLAWFLIDSCKLTLDKDKVIRYALVHDLVETYAGDTYFYDTAGEATKDKREKEAQDRIEREYPQFGDLHETIKEYEKHSDAESRFVYALDKLIDPLNIYLEDGLLWREKGVTLEMLLAKKSHKVAVDPVIEALFHKLIARLRAKPEMLAP